MDRPRPARGRASAGAVVELGGDDNGLLPQVSPCLPDASEALARGAEHLHRMGPRAYAEILAGLIHSTGLAAGVLQRLDRHCALAAAIRGDAR